MGNQCLAKDPNTDARDKKGASTKTSRDTQNGIKNINA